MRRRRLAIVWGVPIEFGPVGITGCFLLLLGIDAVVLGRVLGDPARVLLVASVELFILVAVTVGHELGHALAWRSLGIKVYRCEIHGLYAKTVRAPANTLSWKCQSFAIAAGPLANLILAVLVVPLLSVPLPALWAAAAHFTFLGNLVLALSNLAPLDPLDGGRLRRVLFGTIQSYSGNQIAVAARAATKSQSIQ